MAEKMLAETAYNYLGCPYFLFHSFHLSYKSNLDVSRLSWWQTASYNEISTYNIQEGLKPFFSFHDTCARGWCVKKTRAICRNIYIVGNN